MKVGTVIIGAGPAGLAAAYLLSKSGHKPIVLERSKHAGGLMRSVKRGAFCVDIGRKELYNRLERVDDLWTELIGTDYRSYPHRGGVLFDGHIIDISPAFRGFRRGMPWPLFLRCASDLLRSRVRRPRRAARNLEDYFYQTRGRTLTRIISQGFQEKLSGIRWSEVLLPEEMPATADASLIRTVRGLMARTFSRSEVNTFRGSWRHPSRGTGQICEAFEREIARHGGTILMGSQIREVGVRNGNVQHVTVSCNGDTITFEPNQVISSIPLASISTTERPGRGESPPKHTIVLVYLFSDAPPRFPHGWLNVTCPKTPVGRITNYSSIGAEMVPPGSSCLCCEFFCHGADPLLALEDTAFGLLAADECAKFSLADPTRVTDRLTLRLAGADASQNRHNWMKYVREELIAELARFQNFYFVGRTDLDIATLAGMEAAEAILTGQRTTFDEHLDPKNLPLRSCKKAFEFRHPFE